MNLAILFKLARALPRNGHLVYCLFRDPRTPRWWKIGLGVALGAIVTPFINIPETIPILGEMETAALLVLALKIAVSRAPSHLVAEHEAAIAAGTSHFNKDLEAARDRAGDYRDRITG